ncbi:MAG: class I mannose-6-phosphate isomerase [Selenomonadaceae bacterium]|nr:class I mannose-6-phosphate isomerase [Selenomonadaceae bacterium]
MKLKAPLKDYLWGGVRLKEDYGKETNLDKVAESWELSCHKDGESVIVNGREAGKTLTALTQEHAEVLGRRGAAFSYFPLLIKLIDAKDNLSVQVHPNNDYALRVEGEYGKTEMWYIVDAEPGASLLYGFKETITPEEFARRIEDNTLLEVCNKVPVQKGDVFFIEAGTLHAIGAGILICEIQQNSNTTYRIYDYGRVGSDGKPRQLHVDKAKEVTKLMPPTRDTKPLASIDLFPQAKAELLAACEYFTVYHFNVQGEAILYAGEESFQAATVLKGKLTVTGGGESLALTPGDTVFLPANLQEYKISGEGEFILSMV